MDSVSSQYLNNLHTTHNLAKAENTNNKKIIVNRAVKYTEHLAHTSAK